MEIPSDIWDTEDWLIIGQVIFMYWALFYPHRVGEDLEHDDPVNWKFDPLGIYRYIRKYKVQDE